VSPEAGKLSDPGVAGILGESKAKEVESAVTGKSVRLKLFRGDAAGGEWKDYEVPLDTGMVVLDAVHRVQATQQPDLACRWNCKAGKCGSCSAEVNGMPRLMCMTRISDFPEGSTIQVAPLKAFPVVKDLVTDVKWNFRQNERILPFTPREMTPEETARGEFNMKQMDVDRVQEFRKCIECFLCQDVCHVLRTHRLHDEFQGPRFMIRIASLEMHPADAAGRLDSTWHTGGIGLCNITKCCTEVCPEHIHITDNGIIPLKERIVSRHDPLARAWRAVTGTGKELPMAKTDSRMH
jgi:succinate dehydrogenase / fumarate reductase, iron-sulfur subunit